MPCANPGGSRGQTCDLIIQNGHVLTLDAGRRKFAPGALAITGHSIAAVGSEAEVLAQYRADRIIDARGGIVHPGLIDAHNHIVHGTSRGVFGSGMASKSNVSFADWKAGVTSDDEFVATEFAALEMLRMGFTTFVEPGTAFDTDAIAAAADAVGVRTLLAAPYLWDEVSVMQQLPGLESASLYRRAPPDRERCLRELDRELRWNRNPDGRVHGYVSVYGLGTASDELLKTGKSIADKAGVVFQQHEGYTPASSAADRARLAQSRIRHLEQLGVLAGTTLIHMYVFEEGDVDILARSGTSVVTCPVAYMELSIAAEAAWRVHEFCERGIPVALGTDGARSCVIGDAAQCAFLLAASSGWRMTPDDLLAMQTLQAAWSAGMSDRIGSLEPGKRADVVIRRTDQPELYPGIDPVHQLALMARGGTVDTVVVNGEVVMRRGHSTRVDEEHVLASVQSSVRRRMQRLALSAG
jgi:5-methylthioadenosine/S-adenosylhomocysteine deaminase